MNSWRVRRVENHIRRTVTSTDCEEYNKLHDLLDDTRTSLRAYLELLQKNELTWKVIAKRTRKLNRNFTRNYPLDHADPRVVAKARAQALASVPPTPPPQPPQNTPSDSIHPIVVKLVHDYLSELDSFALTKFHKIETAYRRVALHREVHKLLSSHDKRRTDNMNQLAVNETAYKLALSDEIAPLRHLCNKRYVAFKAVRVAYWASQLRAFDAVRDSLRRNMGSVCIDEIDAIDNASVGLHGHIDDIVSRLTAINIREMTPEAVERYMPTSDIDDDCENSFARILPPHDPRSLVCSSDLHSGRATPVRGTPLRETPRLSAQLTNGIFRMFSPRNLSMPAIRDEEDDKPEIQSRSSLPLEACAMPLDSVPRDSRVTPISPVSSVDGPPQSDALADDDEDLEKVKPTEVAPRRRNVQWLKRKFETTEA